jgi:hypothetical protein
MSFFGKMFGGGKKGEAAPTTGEAIQKLRETEEMLIKKQDFLEKKIEQVRCLVFIGPKPFMVALCPAIHLQSNLRNNLLNIFF